MAAEEDSSSFLMLDSVRNENVMSMIFLIYSLFEIALATCGTSSHAPPIRVDVGLCTV